MRSSAAAQVAAHTGQQVGGVAPVGHPRPLRTIVDPALAEFPVIWAGGGDENTMFATTFGRAAGWPGHPRWPIEPRVPRPGPELDLAG